MNPRLLLVALFGGILLAGCGGRASTGVENTSAESTGAENQNQAEPVDIPSTRVELTGMLLIIDPEKCPLADGCGPEFNLLGRNFTTQVAIRGNINPEHDQRILSIIGQASPLSPEERQRSGYRHIHTVVDVEDYRLRSTVRYQPFLERQATDFIATRFGCELLWDKSYSWNITGDVPRLNVRMTDTRDNESQPWVELTYNGNTGHLLDAMIQPQGADPCAL